MDYVSKLSSVLMGEDGKPVNAAAPLAVPADAIAQSAALINRGGSLLKKLLGGVRNPSQKLKIVNYIVKRILDHASWMASSRTGKRMRWAPRKSWAPVREDAAATLMDVDEGCKLIQNGLDGLAHLPDGKMAKVIKQIVNQLKGNATFAHNTRGWQAKNLANDVNRHIKRAIQSGQPTIKLSLKGLSGAAWAMYKSEFRRLGIKPKIDVRSGYVIVGITGAANKKSADPAGDGRQANAPPTVSSQKAAV